MKTLVITEDLTAIKSLGGIGGSMYAKLIELVLIVSLWWFFKLHGSEQVSVVSSSPLTGTSKQKLLFWDKLLSENKLEQERNLVWEEVNKNLSPLFKGLSYRQTPFLETWKTYLAIYLSHQVFAYRQALVRLFKDKKAEQVVIIGANYQSKLAEELAKARGVRVVVWPDFGIAKMNRWLLDWLYSRQLKNQAQSFIAHQVKNQNDFPQNSVLLATSFFRHLKTLLPLHRQLRIKGIPSMIIGDSWLAQKTVSSQGVSSKQYWDLAGAINPIDKRKLYADQKQVAVKHWRQWRKQFDSKIWSGYLKTMCVEAFPLMCLYLEAAEKLISSIKVKRVVLVSDVRPLEVALGLMAKKLKLKSILVSPNTILSLDAINQYQLAEKITVVGPHLKKALRQLRIPANKIKEVGDLRFDWLLPTKLKQLRQKTHKRLGLKAKDKLFLLISFRSNPRIPLSEKEKFFKICHLTVSAIPQARLIVKPHPTEKIESLKLQLKQWGITNSLVTNNQDFELIDLLSVAQATLLTWSMSGFESLLTGVPVVVVNPTDKDYDQIIPYVKGGGAQLAKSNDDLTPILTRLIAEKDYYQHWVDQGRKFVSQYIKLPDGKVADRIISLFS